MTLSKKEEIKLFARLQALYSRLNQINGDLIRLEAEIEAQPKLSIPWKGAETSEEILTKSEKDIENEYKVFFLSILKSKLTTEKVEIEKQIAEI